MENQGGKDGCSRVWLEEPCPRSADDEEIQEGLCYAILQVCQQLGEPSYGHLLDDNQAAHVQWTPWADFIGLGRYEAFTTGDDVLHYVGQMESILGSSSSTQRCIANLEF